MKYFTFIAFLSVLIKCSLTTNYGNNGQYTDYGLQQPKTGYHTKYNIDKQWSTKPGSNYKTHLLQNHYNQLYQHQQYQQNQLYSQSIPNVQSYPNTYTGYRNGLTNGRSYSKGYNKGSYYGGYSGYSQDVNDQFPSISVVLPSNNHFMDQSSFTPFGSRALSGIGGFGNGVGIPANSFVNTAFGYGGQNTGFGFGGLTGYPVSSYLFGSGRSFLDTVGEFISSDTGKLVSSAILGTVLYKTIG